MNNEFVSYEIALKLKELGFKEQCFSFYDIEKKLYASEGYYKIGYNVLNEEVIAPLYQQVFRWFRNKYGIDFSINTIYSRYNENTSKKYSGVIDNKTVFTNVGFYDTYEEAQKECILNLISIIKNQKK
jgi:hypothetical protein